MCTPTGSRWTSNNYITRCHRWLESVSSVPVTVRVSWGQDAKLRASGWLRAWALGDPWLSSPAKMRKKCCDGKKNFGSICCSLSPSPTHLSHITNINPFENKVWEVYFYKEVYLFVHWSRHYCWLCFHLYLYMYCVVVCGYTTHIYLTHWWDPNRYYQVR